MNRGRTEPCELGPGWKASPISPRPALAAMNYPPASLLRALAVIWRRLGGARAYVMAIAGAIMILAALGVVHLFSSPPTSDVSANAEAKANQKLPQTSRPLAANQSASTTPIIAITGITPKKRRFRDGSRGVVAKIAIASRPNAKIGEVEILVFFFDVTRAGELRPTDAQVAYNWITPERDWTDPSPKYLEATYLRPRTPRRAPERLRYGGLLVRVYSDGQLQDERSEPKALLAALRSAPPAGTPTPARVAESASIPPEATSTAVPTMTAFESSSTPLDSPVSPQIETARSPTPTPAPSLLPQNPIPAKESTAPTAKPAPGKPGFIYSPENEKFTIDVRGVAPGTEINDPYTGKPVRVP